MDVPVHFYSFFKDLTGCSHTTVKVRDNGTVGDVLAVLEKQHPRLAAMKKSTLIAVGLDYESAEYVLKPGDEVSLFPPVQGG
jgi:molybdopterin converting factor small subunit